MEADGLAIRRLRNEHSLSLRELAALAKVTSDNIWRIETGAIKRPHPRTLRKLAEALNVEPKALMQAAQPTKED